MQVLLINQLTNQKCHIIEYDFMVAIRMNNQIFIIFPFFYKLKTNDFNIHHIQLELLDICIETLVWLYDKKLGRW